ncbi:hypothetical protein ONS95_007704 [Cadophora gregata]|uniref:uncharacterized protein n=1 Tax=Cadophora gregata TaxID=51156 RepID=UPI0026DCFC83|nr:uncharacterized protein ONS95_007704 [Cadophora gregata]KAK0118823.1 hypothetical protein ONS96_011905 [Cadophora gregata f. sp. sojae]KAK0126084.1 hypothetical protein ONS95_007704 [Cadophora gregata]
MSAVRRRSSQYSLFPSCSPTPQQTSALAIATATAPGTAIAPHGTAGGNTSPSLRKRHSEGSVRERATKISLRASLSSWNLNIFPSNNSELGINTQQPKKSNNMGRLIPLKLEANMSDTKSSSSSQKAPPSLPLTELASVPIPAPLNPSKPSKRARPGPVTDLTILPYTQKEWGTVMEEVRLLYSKGQYKHCAMRCKQILDGIKDPYRVHPLYSIYLSFFAASSLEMTASTLHSHSSTKLPLFQESLAFYQKAESFVEYASFSTDPNIAFATRQIAMYGQASHSSLSSSIRSSVDSVFSQASASSVYCASSSYGDSPTFEEHCLRRSASSSSSSEDSEDSRRCSGRFQNRKKKVSFSLQLPTLDSESPLDLSPKSVNVANASQILDAFPAPPSKETSPSRSSSPTKLRRESLSNYYHGQSVARYRTHLTSLKSQLDFHISSIHSQIGLLAEARKPRRSNTPTQYSFDRTEEKSTGADASAEAHRRPELRERIERLKELGWRRKRFDGERYRLLCEKALGEVNERP